LKSRIKNAIITHHIHRYNGVDIMLYLWTILGILGFVAILVLTTCYICFRRCFYTDRKNDPKENEFSIPDGEIYEPYRDQMINWMKEVRAMPHEDVEITSFDGLKLRGRYYEYQKGAPIELMFHGYRGNSERDLCGGVQRCFALRRNVLIVDQRGSGRSEGKIITFGVNESKDCVTWIDFIISHYGKDSRIILTGISMGGATVLMTAGKNLPKNVICVLADCPYSSQKEIIKKVIREMKLPENLLYPFVKLAARIFGHFNLEETTPIEAIKNCKVPVIFIHGESDAFVPCQMSRDVYAICTTPKIIFTVKDADHGLAYLVDPDGYFRTLRHFCAENNIV